MDNTDKVMLIEGTNIAEHLSGKKGGTLEWEGTWAEFLTDNADDILINEEQETIADTLDSGEPYMFNQTGEVMFLVKGE